MYWARQRCELSRLSWLSPCCHLFGDARVSVTPEKEYRGRGKKRNQKSGRPALLTFSQTTSSPLCSILSATWPLKQSSEFTDDGLWLRGAESSVG